jgi:hypothetical protein
MDPLINTTGTDPRGAANKLRTKTSNGAAPQNALSRMLGVNIPGGANMFSFDPQTGRIRVATARPQQPRSEGMSMIGAIQPAVNMLTGQADNHKTIASARIPGGDREYGDVVDGIKLDPTTLSGKAEGDLFFEDNNGPLAVFKTGDRINGYMRLATQAAKTADNINLSNNSGKATPQKPSTKSILGGAR